MLVLKEFSCSVQEMQCQIQSISHYKFRCLACFQVSLQIWLVPLPPGGFYGQGKPLQALHPNFLPTYTSSAKHSDSPFSQPTLFSISIYSSPIAHCKDQFPCSPYMSILPIFFCNGSNCQLLYTNAAWDEEVNGREVSKETENQLPLTKHVFISFNKLIKQLTDKAIKLN